MYVITYINAHQEFPVLYLYLYILRDYKHVKEELFIQSVYNYYDKH